jgi:hypothetical protein
MGIVDQVANRVKSGEEKETDTELHRGHGDRSTEVTEKSRQDAGGTTGREERREEEDPPSKTEDGAPEDGRWAEG